MRGATRNPDIGQLAFPEIPLPPAEIGLDHRNSFATATKPAFHGLSIEMYADITPDKLAFVTPQFLQESLIGVPKDANNAVYYRNPETRESTNVAVTPAEFKLLGGSIITLGNRVLNGVLDSRSTQPVRSVDKEAATRGGIHAVTGKLTALQSYDRLLATQAAEVNWLINAANNPGYAWKDGFDLKVMLINVRTFALADMMTAMSQAGDWSPEKAADVEKILEYRLFFDRNRNRHITNWQHVLGVEKTYLGYKRAIFNEKIAKAEQYIEKNAE